MSRIRSSLSYADVTATIAVFLALGGGAYAALKLPKNSVGTTQIKNGAVISSKVKNGSLLSQDFKAGQLPAGVQGQQGPKGDTGDAGPKGDAGPSDAYSAKGAFGFAKSQEAAITVPVGLYVVIATADAYNPTGGTLNNPACDLLGPTDYDKNFGGSVPPSVETNIALQAVYSAGGTIRLICGGPTSSFTYGHLRLAAIRVGALH